MKTGGITFKTADGKAYHLEIDRINSNILTAGSPGRIRKIRDHVEKAEVIEGDRGLTVLNGEYKGLRITAMATGMGPASTAVVLPEALERSEGPITVLRLGTCGGMQPFVRIGHLVISSGAVRDEMSTAAAVGPEYPAVADAEILPLLVASAEKRGYGLHEKLWVGITHTKDDIYFTETPQFSPSRELMTSKLESYKRMGVLASEMEFSVHCILRDFYQVQKRCRILVGAILAVLSSTLEGGAVDVSKADRDALERDLIEIGLDALLMTDRLRRGKSIDTDLKSILSRLMRPPKL